MNILDRLKDDHRKIAKLFKEIESTPGKKAKLQIFMELRNLLDAHMIAEEDVLYSRLRENPKSKSLILESFEEHHMAKTLSDEITDLSPSDESWMAKISVLREMIEHHVEEEESHVFKCAKKLFSKKKLIALNLEFEIRQDEFIERRLLFPRKAA